MLICPKCSKEMACIKNGVKVIYQGGFHVYFGDKYGCKTCGNVVILTNQHPHNPSKPISPEEHDVVMP